MDPFFYCSQNLLEPAAKRDKRCSLSRHFLDIPAYICLGGGSITRRGPFEFPKGNSKLVNGYGELFKADARDSAWMGGGIPRSIRIKATLSDPRACEWNSADIFPNRCHVTLAVSLEKGERGDYSFLLFLLSTFVLCAASAEYCRKRPLLYISIDLSSIYFSLFTND